ESIFAFTTGIKDSPIDRSEPALKERERETSRLEMDSEDQVVSFSGDHERGVCFLCSARAIAASNSSIFILFFRDGSPCIPSYISQTRVITSVSILAEISGRRSAAGAPNKTKQAITSLRVGGRCFFSMRETTSARCHPNSCASSRCDRPHRRR